MINDIVKLCVFLFLNIHLNECVLFVVPFLQYKKPILCQPCLFTENHGKVFLLYAQLAKQRNIMDVRLRVE